MFSFWPCPVRWSDFWEKNWTLLMLGQILLWPHFQNFTFQYCFLRLRIHTICTLHYWWSYEDKFEWWDTFLFSSSFFPTFFGLFFSFFFHPSLVFLETILRVDGFPIVSVLGSCCHHLLICTYILPHSFAFVETISAEIHLMPPPAFTAVISVPPGQSSSSSDEVCTVLLHVHLLQIQGTPDSLPKR